MLNLRYVRGERPSCAGPTTRAEASGSSVAGNWPWGRTRAGPRGPVTKWSARSESLRVRMVAYQRGAPFPVRGVAWGEGREASILADGM
jgi:hypothetical protein